MPDIIIIFMTALIVYCIIGAVLIIYEIMNSINNGSTWKNAISSVYEYCKNDFFDDNPKLNKLGIFVRNLCMLILLIPVVICTVFLIIIYVVFSSIGKFLFYKKEKKA